MSNYYTPKEEEFHKGFRYEKRSSNGNWEEYVYGITPGASRNISSDLSRDRQILEGNYRVKYLDQKDIEELGWGENGYDEYGEEVYIFNRNPTPNMADEIVSTFILSLIQNGLIRIKRLDNGGFGGMVDHVAYHIDQINCRNYNELKRLMSQLNITQ